MNPDRQGTTEDADTWLADLLALVRRGIELDLRANAPGTVTSYNPATRRASVSLGFLPVLDEDGEDVPQPPVIIQECPVEFPGSALPVESGVTFPLMTGTTGMLSFTDRALAQWLVQGAPADPVNGRTHALGDGVFRPGLRPAATASATSLLATVVHGALVHLGGDLVPGTGALIKGTELVAALGPIAATLAAVPPPVDLATALTAIIANTTAIQAIISAIGANLSATTFTA